MDGVAKKTSVSISNSVDDVVGGKLPRPFRQTLQRNSTYMDKRNWLWPSTVLCHDLMLLFVMYTSLDLSPQKGHPQKNTGR